MANKAEALAEQLHKSWQPGDRVHMEFLLGTRLLRGLTKEVAYKIAVAYPAYAKKLIARKFKK